MVVRRSSWFFLLVFVLIVLVGVASMRPSAPPASRAGNVRAETDPYPGITQNNCTYLPDPRSNVSFACGVDNMPSATYAFVGAPVRLNLTVEDPSGENMTVTIGFDASWDFVNPPTMGNASAVKVVNVTSPGPGENVSLEINWTYDHLNDPWPILPGQSSYFLVYIVVNDSLGSDLFDNWGCPSLASGPYGQCLFTVAVAINSAPSFTESLASNYFSTVSFPDPVVQPFSQYIIAQDIENDTITATWDWGDGNETVEALNGTPMDGVVAWGNHSYSIDTNTTPRDYVFYINVTISDGIPGHDNRSNATVRYHLNFDDAPTLQSLKVNKSTWLVGESVFVASSYGDGDSDNVTYYWDLGDGTTTAPVTVPASPAPSPANITHAFTVPGNYTIRLWANDGVGKCVWGGDACLQSHEVNASATIEVLGNRAPTVALSLSTPPQVTGKPAGFTLALFDPDGDPLNLTWDFGDGNWLTNYTNATSDAAHALSSAVQLFQNHTYLRPGPAPTYNYTVRVWADDGHVHNQSSSTLVFVGSLNEPPVILPHLELTNDTAYVNQTFTLDVAVLDLEGDTVNLTVDWGDGSPINATDVLLKANVTNTTSFSHRYVVSGQWSINVTATDDQVWVTRAANGTLLFLNHTVLVPVSINVQEIPVPPPPDDWTWVDYTTLGAVLAVPIGLSVRAILRRREERREE